jgi:3-hydroxymyristoyl/3-hydroxydecanoyl-(acyl carrier protein) dehydratase
MASPEKIIADESVITEYIPQKEPMVMVGKLLSIEGGKTISSFLIREDNIFCENGHFLEAGLIENMAQTAATGVGYLAKKEKKDPPVGFIGGIKSLRIYSLPETGDEIITEITVEHQVFDATVVNGRIYLKDTLIAECELKIFILKS